MFDFVLWGLVSHTIISGVQVAVLPLVLWSSINLYYFTVRLMIMTASAKVSTSLYNTHRTIIY